MNTIRARFVSTEAAAEAQGVSLIRFPVFPEPFPLYDTPLVKSFDHNIAVFRNVAIVLPTFLPVLIEEALALVEQVPSESIYDKNHSHLDVNVSTGYARIEEPCILLGGWTVWYHWLLNFLPRLRVVYLAQEEIPDLCHRKVAVSSDVLARPAYRSTLAAMGVASDRLLDMGNGPIVHFADLAIPNIFPDALFCPSTIEVMREKMLAYAQTSQDKLSGDGSKRVYISRDKGPPSSRRVWNHSTIDSVLAYFGFKICYMENHSFVEQVRLIRDAECVAGTHGSGLANIMFARRGAKFLEIGGFPSSMFSTLANLLGMENYRLNVPAQHDIFQHPVHIDDNRAEYNDYIVDPYALREVMEKMGLEPSMPSGRSKAHTQPVAG